MYTHTLCKYVSVHIYASLYMHIDSVASSHVDRYAWRSRHLAHLGATDSRMAVIAESPSGEGEVPAKIGLEDADPPTCIRF